MALQTALVVPVPMAAYAGSRVDASLYLVLHDVVTSVGLLPVRSVAVLQGGSQRVVDRMTFETKGFTVTAVAQVLPLPGVAAVTEEK